MANGSAADRTHAEQLPPPLVRAELDHLLKSPQFSGSERLCSFLHFVVEKTLAGESEDIKEYLIATEVYRRGELYDPKADSIVRVEASRLRRKLRQYYEAGGRASTLQFDLPKGSYVPTYIPRPSAAEIQVEAPAPQPVPPTVMEPERAVPRHRNIPVLAAGAVALIALAGGSLWFTGRKSVPAGPQLLPITSVAVLPLVNLSANPQDETLADGLTEAITNTLSRSSQLRVTGRTSAYRYKGRPDTVPRIGAELGVGSVLEGSVQREGNQLRVLVQLVGTADGFHIWSQSFERVFHDSLTAEREISQTVGRMVTERLVNRTKEGATANVEALRLYQAGRELLSAGATDHLLMPDRQPARPMGTLLECIDLFNRAIAIDPKYARAYAGLAEAYYVASDYDAALISKAQASAESALGLDANLPEAYEVLGYVRFIHQWDFPGAEQAFRRSIELSPRNVSSHRLYADVSMLLGHSREAAAQLRKAQEAFPSSPIIRTEMAIVSYNLRDYPAMVQQAQSIRSEFPQLPVGHWTLGLAYEQQGKLREAEMEFRECLQLSPNNLRCTPALGHVLGKLGRREEALKVMASYKQSSPYCAALIQMGIGDKESALQDLERAYNERDQSLPYARIDPRFDPVAKDPRFTAIMTKLKLPPP